MSDLTFGKYSLLEQLHVGPSAETFKAKARGAHGFERLVALRRALPHVAESSAEEALFVQATRVAALLLHANVPQVIDLGRIEGTAFVATEYVRGKSLQALLEDAKERKATLPLPLACHIATKVCEALDYAHDKRDEHGERLGIVHGELSPRHVLVSYAGHVKLKGFGPETQADDAARRDDVRGLGKLLAAMLGDHPRLPEELGTLVVRARTQQGYASAASLHDALQAFTFGSGRNFGRNDVAAFMRRRFADDLESDDFRALRDSSVPSERPRSAIEEVAPTAKAAGMPEVTPLAAPRVTSFEEGSREAAPAELPPVERPVLDDAPGETLLEEGPAPLPIRERRSTAPPVAPAMARASALPVEPLVEPTLPVEPLVEPALPLELPVEPPVAPELAGERTDVQALPAEPTRIQRMPTTPLAPERTQVDAAPKSWDESIETEVFDRTRAPLVIHAEAVVTTPEPATAPPQAAEAIVVASAPSSTSGAPSPFATPARKTPRTPRSLRATGYALLTLAGLAAVYLVAAVIGRSEAPFDVQGALEIRPTPLDATVLVDGTPVVVRSGRKAE
ncbi:MAG: protein kinase [Myxococcota bacterium]